MTTTRKVPPKDDLPKLSKSKELRLVIADDVSAAGYDAIEEATEKVVSLVKDMEDGKIRLVMADEDSSIHSVYPSVRTDDVGSVDRPDEPTEKK